MSFIREQQLGKKFYQDSMSLFIKGSPGIPERIDMWVDILNNVTACGEDIFRYLDIFYYEGPNKNYLTFVRQHGNGNCEWLDIIGAIYGLRREIVMTEFRKDGKNVTEPGVIQVTLNDKEFLIYIEATLRRFLFDGTRQGLRNVYEGTSLVNSNAYRNKFSNDPDVITYLNQITHKSVLSELGITYIDGGSPAECNICMTNISDASDNLINLFLNGLLTIESMGITYTKLLSNDFETGVWNESKYYDAMQPPHAVYAGEKDTI